MRFYTDIINASKHKDQLLQDIALHMASIQQGPDSDAAEQWDMRYLEKRMHPYNESEAHLLYNVLPDYAEVFGSVEYLLGAWDILPIDFDIGSEYPEFGFNYDTGRVAYLEDLRWCAVTRGYRTALPVYGCEF